MNKTLVISSMLMLSASFSLQAAGNHAAGHGHEAHWMAPATEQTRANPVTASDESIQAGAQLFRQNCVSCHGANAEGDGPAGMALNPRPTDLRAMSGRHSDGDFAWKIANGRGGMPSWQSTLDKQKIWHLVNYIQSLAREGSAIGQEHQGHDQQHNH